MRRRVLIIAGLSTLAVAWPILDMFGRNPEVFVANRTSSWQLIGFALLVALTVPLLASLVVWGFEQWSPSAGRIAYGAVVAVLAAAIGLVVARQATDSIWITLLIVGLVLFLVPTVDRMGGTFLPWTAAALPIVIGLFLFASPAAGLIWEEAEVAGSGDVVAPAPIVFIQMDEFPLASLVTPEGEVNWSLFPNFARLADEGTWYRNALSNSIATTQSIPSILTGRTFERGLAPSSEDHPANLFTLLADDYEMHVIEWVASMCPAEVCPEYAGRSPARFASLIADAVVVYSHLAAPPGLEDSLPSIDNSWAGFLGQAETPDGEAIDVPGLPVPAPSLRADWVDWLQRIANGVGGGARPTLSYAHVPAPHVPWVTNPSGTHYTRPEQYTEVEGVGGDGRWAGSPTFGVIGFQRHLYQVGMLDLMLGRIFDSMDRSGTWDDSLVVVLADHGASFELGEHRRWPFDGNIDDLYRVPLFIKYPGQEAGEVVDDPAFGLDVLPTIVDVLDVRTDWEFDGISLLEVEGTDRPHEPIFWCCDRVAASTDLDTLFEQVRRNYDWVPDQNSWRGVAGAGEFAALVGESATTLEIVADSAITWQLDLGSELVTGTERGGMAQTYWNGRIAFPAGSDVHSVLFLLNGSVAGTGAVVPDGPGTGTFAGMVAEELIHAGPNEVDVLIPAEDGHWLSGTVGDLTVELKDESGRLLEIRPESTRQVQVDQVQEGAGGSLQFTGWAADIVAKAPPQHIYVFAGSQLLASGPPNLDNGNVVVWFESENLLRSGFRFSIPRTSIPHGTAQLTVVAEFDDWAVAEAVAIPAD